MTRFAILGPLAVEGDDGPLVVPGKRRKTVLARLLVARGVPVGAERLAEDVWDGSPPPGATSTMKSHLSFLRQQLGRSRIRESAGTVVLELGEGELDAACFEDELRRGRDAYRAGDPARAAHVLEGALARWRGPALADVVGPAWADAEQALLHELRTTALELSLDARLDLGRYHEVVDAAERLLAEQPLREHVAAQLMTALYRSSRQADALRVFQRVRHQLREELGVDPSPELVELEQAVLLQLPDVELGYPRPAGPGNGRPPTARAHDAAPRGTGWLFSRPPRSSPGTSATRPPLPRRLASPPETGIVGRHAELDALMRASRRAVAGEGREMVLVAGEAGIGKTTLVAEAARAAFAQGACVLLGRGEQGLSVPYRLLGEPLDYHLRLLGADERARLLDQVGPYAPELVRLAPCIAGTGPHFPSRATDTDAERYLLFAAAVGLVAAISERRPLVLVLDDLQWADLGSVRLLGHVLAAEEPLRLLVLATVCEEELSHPQPLLSMLRGLEGQPGVSRMELGGLRHDDVVALVEGTTGRALGAEGVALAARLYDETDGNPFFVTELLRHLTETDSTSGPQGHGPAAPAALPTSVRAVIGARASRLGSTAEEVLSVASVIGQDFDLDLLVRASDRDGDEVLGALQRARAAALVRELGDDAERYAFTHALVQHSLYEVQSLTRRARTHRRVAVGIEALGAARAERRLGELAHHWRATGLPEDRPRALGYLHRAAEGALVALAPADALAHFDEATELLAELDNPNPTLAVDLGIGRGTAQRQTGDPAFRDTLLDAARRAIELEDAERLVAAVLASDRGLTAAVGTVDAERVEILEAALAHLPPGRPERALVLAALCQEVAFVSPLERRRALADEALGAATSSGDDATIVRVTNAVAYPLLVPVLLGQSLKRSADALSRAERLGDPVLLFWTASRRFVTAACAADMVEADRCLVVADDCALRLGQPVLTWMQTVHLAARALIAGDADRAEQLANAALQLATESGQPDALVFYGAQLMGAHLQRGTLGDLAPLIGQAARDNPGLPAFVGALALAHLEGNRNELAGELLREFAASGFEAPMDASWLATMVCYSEVAVACRDIASAEVLLERLQPWDGRLAYSDPTVVGPVGRTLGGLAATLGRYDEAERYLVRSAELCRDIGAKFFAACIELTWGETLAERGGAGDVERARAMFVRARAAATAQGYSNVERRATEDLRALGARASTEAGAGPGA